MCRRITCRTCNKPSYSGCGLHIEEVLGDVAVADRCTCDQSGGLSWFKRMFRKSA